MAYTVHTICLMLSFLFMHAEPGLFQNWLQPTKILTAGNTMTQSRTNENRRRYANSGHFPSLLQPTKILRAGNQELTQSGTNENIYGISDRDQEKECYYDLGCFPTDYPWTSLLRPFPAPQSPREINTKIYCYSRRSSKRYDVKLWPTISMQQFPLDGQKKTTVLIAHGFLNSANDTWVEDLKDAYLEAVDANVCLVDWGNGAINLNYLQVASNTRVVGAEVARFIKHLQTYFKLNVKKLHLIGHSLGAHIMGYAAKSVPGVYRITGLDAAQPGFEGCDQLVHLDKDDAQFVDGIHTNGSPFIPTLGFGFITPFGHVDIYMNGGLRQPGCDLPRVSDIKSISDLALFPIKMVRKWVACSHERAINYFTQALRKNCTIWAKAGSITMHMVTDTIQAVMDPLVSRVNKCDVNSCVPLGLDTPKYHAKGTYASYTAGTPPYCDSPEVCSEYNSDILKSSIKVANAVPKLLNPFLKFGGGVLWEADRFLGENSNR